MNIRWLLVMMLILFPLLANAAVPNIPLKDFNGKTRNVNEFIGKGKWVVVVIWAHDCPICNREIHHLAFFHAEHRKKDAIVLGVSIDGWDKKKQAAAFVDRHSLNFTNLIAEPEYRVIQKFGVADFYGTPTFYIYTPKGKLVKEIVGPVTQAALDNIIKGKPSKSAKK
jgi:peroxiredoxin